MIQYSIYMRLVISAYKGNYEIKALKALLPNNGNIRILKITNQQYGKMLILQGNKRINETINTDERFIKINCPN